MKKTLQKGFTLVELLVVMGILAILMAAVVVGIDPLDKLNAAGDAKGQQDVGTIARAMEAYAAGHGGTYPCTTGTLDQNALVTLSGELKTIPTAPSGRSYIYGLCNSGVGSVAVEVKSKKFLKDSNNTQFYIPSCAGTCTGYWVWCSSSGKASAQSHTASCP